MQNRNRLISFMQTFGIILVVLGHSTYQLMQAGHTPAIYKWIYTFHMPLFFFISGYLLRYSNDRKGRQLSDMPALGKDGFITKKIKRLLIPYFVISSLVFIPKTMMSAMALRPVDMSVWSYLDMLLYPQTNVIGYFWFLPTLFMIFCLALLASRIKVRVNDILLLAALIAVNLTVPDIALIGLGDAIYNSIFFAAGYVVCKYKLENMVGRHAAVTATVTFIISIALLRLPEGGIRFLISSFNGILMVIAAAHIYTGKKLHFLDHIDGASYTIYLLSWFPQVASQQILIALIPNIPWQITTTLAFFSGLYVPLLIYKWLIAHKDRTSCRYIMVVLGMQSTPNRNKPETK